eukprot:9682780-Lingulodinium_polyedra.AAC.1
MAGSKRAAGAAGGARAEVPDCAGKVPVGIAAVGLVGVGFAVALVVRVLPYWLRRLLGVPGSAHGCLELPRPAQPVQRR